MHKMPGGRHTSRSKRNGNAASCMRSGKAPAGT